MIPHKTLFCDPWVGEFGWELFCWHGYLRKLAERYTKVIVACRTGHELLYRDFATDIVNYDPQIEETDMYVNRREPNHRQFHQYYTQGLHSVTVVHNNRYPARWWVGENWSEKQDLISFRLDGGTGYNVLMLVRDTAKCNTGFRNWPIEHATEVATQLLKMGYTVACIGKNDSALHVPGTEDCRGISLDALAYIMSDSQVIIGPQSGPVHFGTLCKLAQVTWQTNPDHVDRVVRRWNPFNVPVITMASDISYWKRRALWLPTVQNIVTETQRMIRRVYLT